MGYLAAYWEWCHGWLCCRSVGKAQASVTCYSGSLLNPPHLLHPPHLQLYLDGLDACLKLVVVWHLEQAFLGASSASAVSACCVVTVPPKNAPLFQPWGQHSSVSLHAPKAAHAPGGDSLLPSTRAPVT